jgi:cell fate (sporulation/competence/biofilm development) regulator YlbF (YheA/YmcA/DUF963 family)
MKDIVLNLVYDLVDEIKSKEEYIELLELKKVMDSDPYIIDLLDRFNKSKNKFEEVSKYGKYHPDLKQVQLDLAEVKTEVFTNKIIQKYKKMEKELQKILDEASRQIAQGVSPNIKHPNDMGLINKH